MITRVGHDTFTGAVDIIGVRSIRRKYSRNRMHGMDIDKQPSIREDVDLYLLNLIERSQHLFKGIDIDLVDRGLDSQLWETSKLTRQFLRRHETILGSIVNRDRHSGAVTLRSPAGSDRPHHNQIGHGHQSE